MEKFRLACLGGLFVVGVMLFWRTFAWLLEFLTFLFLLLIGGIGITVEFLDSLPSTLLLLLAGSALAGLLLLTTGRK